MWDEACGGIGACLQNKLGSDGGGCGKGGEDGFTWAASWQQSQVKSSSMELWRRLIDSNTNQMLLHP